MGSSCLAQGAQLGPLRWSREVGWGRVGGGLERERTDVYLWLMHTTVQQKLTQHQSNHSPIKK